MNSFNKLEKLSSKKGIFKGGFTTLTENQLLKLKGGSGSTGSDNCQCGNCNCDNCKCTGQNCKC